MTFNLWLAITYSWQLQLIYYGLIKESSSLSNLIFHCDINNTWFITKTSISPSIYLFIYIYKIYCNTCIINIYIYTYILYIYIYIYIYIYLTCDNRSPNNIRLNVLATWSVINFKLCQVILWNEIENHVVPFLGFKVIYQQSRNNEPMIFIYHVI